MTKNLEALVAIAARLIETLRLSEYGARDGYDAGEGFTVVYNETTGQSKVVLYHAESGYVFKQYWGFHEGEHFVDPIHSGRYIGQVVFDDTEYQIRLPEFFYFDGVEVQEFIAGSSFCYCSTGYCEHFSTLRDVTRCSDAHRGNWAVQNGEIVLFDFDGIRLD